MLSIYRPSVQQGRDREHGRQALLEFLARDAAALAVLHGVAGIV